MVYSRPEWDRGSLVRMVKELMSDRILIWVALSVILAMVAGTTLQLRKPQFAPPLNLEMVVKANPPRPVATAASVDVDGVSKPFNSRITRPTLISFWATWCIPCLRELPTIGRFKAMADHGYLREVISLSGQALGFLMFGATNSLLLQHRIGLSLPAAASRQSASPWCSTHATPMSLLYI